MDKRENEPDQKNKDTLTIIARKSLTDMLWGLFEEGFENLDVIIESLVEQLLTKGPQAFKQSESYFPPNTEEEIMKNRNYQQYLSKKFKAKYLNPNEQLSDDKEAEKFYFKEDSKKVEPNNIESKPHQRYENLAASKISKPNEKDIPSLKFNRENIKASLAGESKIDENTLEGTFESLKTEKKLEYDPNFTLIFDFAQHKQITKDLLIMSFVDQYREKNFCSLFMALRPFLFDLLKRREGVEHFLTILRRVSSAEKIVAQKAIKSLEVRDLIALLLESCSPKSMAKLGPWLANNFYPMPIFSQVGTNKYISNLKCCMEIMFQARKKLITSIGTKNSLKTGKSSLLSYMFSTKNPSYFSTRNGFTHPGSVDLYTKLPQDGFEYLVADVNGYVANRDFENMVAKLMRFSQFILVHIVLTDIEEDSRTGKMPLDTFISDLIPKKTNFMVLFRDYNEYEQEGLIEKINQSLKNYSNYNGTVPIPKLDDNEQMIDAQNQKYQVMSSINKALSKLKDLNPIFPIFDLTKANEAAENQQPSNIEIKLEQENVHIVKMLNKKLQESQGKSLYETLFPCFWIDFLLTEELKQKQKMEKNYIDEEQLSELRKTYEEIDKRIQSYQKQKSEIVPSQLVVYIALLLSSNDILRTYLLSETINNWKMPLVNPLKKKYRELCTKKTGMKNDSKSDVNREIKQLEDEMDDKDFSLDTFLDEIHILHEAGKQNDVFFVEGIKQYLSSLLKQGAPINLVNGKTLKFGNKILKEIFEDYDVDDNKVYVISIIGAQSSAKSTLLNVLFGCGFATSAGRCTKGLYATLLQHPNGNHFVIIDTEGLLSIVARDHEFDNLITTMAFSCSHIVLINNKGEINSKLRDLLEICVYAMKHLKLTQIKPKIIFALRDIADNSLDVQREMLIQMKLSLQQAAQKLLIDINNFIEISEEDIFLLPSAFHFSQAENGSSIQTNNNLFSTKVLDLRTYIFRYLETIDKLPLVDLKRFYEQSEQLWNDINGYGKEIMKARNFLEIELKDDGFEKVNEIFKKHDKIFLEKGRALLDDCKSQFRSKSGILPVDFVQLLIKEFNKVRDFAFDDLDRDVINNEKYAAISSYHREFRETLEYNLRWQRQNLISEWKSSLIFYECLKEVDNFKADLKSQVDKILQKQSQSANIIKLFHKIKTKSNENFEQKMEELKKHNIDNLAPEIQGHYECAQQKMHRKEKKYITIPTVGEFIKRINQDKNPLHNESKWLKVSLWPWSNANNPEKLQSIKREFKSIKNELKSIVADISTEDIALNVIEACTAKLTKMETNKLPINYATFMHSCLLEAMFIQYTKTKDTEIARIKKVKAEHEAVLQDEEKHIKELLDLSQDNWGKGKATAQRCYREIQKAFCLTQDLALQDGVMKKIREEFPSPESANQTAYKSSFEISNFTNVVKYVLNINKFINEIYNEKIKLIADFEIERKLDMMRNEFISVIHEVIDLVESWSRDNEMNEKVDLSTLSLHIKKNPKVAKYFSDLYIVQLSNVKSFNHGFKSAMADLLAKFDLKKEIKENIKNKVEEYLNNQYNNLVGCQARCPICNNKCIKPDTQHKDHHTNCHLLAAYSGIHRVTTKEVVLMRCSDPQIYKSRWSYGDKEYKTFDDFINAEEPQWRAEFTIAKEREKHEAFIPSTMMECWVGIKDVLIKYYDLIDKTPPGWENLVPHERRLPENFALEGYTFIEDNS